MKSAGRIFLIIAFYCGILAPGAIAQDKDGNPIPHFLFPSFREGYVKMKLGESFSSLINYNMVEEKMIVEVDSGYRYSKVPDLIDTIYIEDRAFVPFGNVFYEVIANGPVKFYLQNKATATPKGNDVGYGVTSKSVGRTSYSRFELTQVIYQYGDVAYIELPDNVDLASASVYWVHRNGDIQNFINEKQFLRIFPEKSARLKQFIKAEKISFKDRKDMMKLGAFVNRLSGQ